LSPLLSRAPAASSHHGRHRPELVSVKVPGPTFLPQEHLPTMNLPAPSFSDLSLSRPGVFWLVLVSAPICTGFCRAAPIYTAAGLRRPRYVHDQLAALYSHRRPFPPSAPARPFPPSALARWRPTPRHRRGAQAAHPPRPTRTVTAGSPRATASHHRRVQEARRG
jgi:hypothetical protein